MREIILDTETTGLSPAEGHRVVEIGCIELKGGVATGRTFQQYINPQRDVPQESFAVHGLSYEFLLDYPPFSQIFQNFLDFIQDSPLVIHNAKFDLMFLNAELTSVATPPLTNPIVDTLHLARQKFPGASATLDALCRRFRIDLKQRAYHGALLDAHLLAQVYLELGKSNLLTLKSASSQAAKRSRTFRPARTFLINEEEKKQHEALTEKLSRLRK